MRILQVVQKPQRRGAEIFAYQLSNALRGNNHCVRTLYLYPYTGSGELPLYGEDKILGGQEQHPLEKFPGFHPVLLKYFMQQIKEFDPDIIQVNGARTVKYGAFARRFDPQGKWALIYRNIGNPEDWVQGLHYWLFYKYVVMSRVDGIVGVSQTTLDRLVSFYSLEKTTRKILRGVDTNSFQPILSREKMREKMQTCRHAPVLLFVGSLSPEKRPDRLLQIFQLVLQKIPDIHLWLVGEGALRSSLEKQVQDTNLCNNVHFVGVQPNVADYMNAADLLLLTSDTEGIPGVILEAGALGLPTVATNVGGIPESVKDGETGLLFEPTAIEQFANAIVALLRNEPLLHQMGQQAKTLIHSHYALDKIYLEYSEFYELVLSKRKIR